MATRKNSRGKIPLGTQIHVFFRDGWLCRWCHRPTVFAPALKLLDRFVRRNGYSHPLAYYDLRYRRDAAPMLDHLAAVIDHVEAYSTGGEHGEANFATACNKCNVRKYAGGAKEYEKKKPGLPVKGKYGEPKHWDGFVAVFLVLSATDSGSLTASEKAWRLALEKFLSERPRPPANQQLQQTAEFAGRSGTVVSFAAKGERLTGEGSHA